MRRGPKTWLLRYDGPPGPDGERKQRYETHRDGHTGGYPLTLTGARDRLKALTLAVKEGRSGTAGKETINHFAEMWRANQSESGKLRQQSLDWYERMYRVHISEVIGGLKLKDVDAEDLRRVLRSVKANGKSARTQGHVHTTMRTMFKWAVREGLIVNNPMLKVDAPGGVGHEVQAPDADTVRRMLDELAHLPYGLAYHLLAFSGARRSEICGLKWEGVDFAKSTITIAGTLVELKGQGIVYLPPKTRSSNRVIAMDPETMVLLRQHRARQSRGVLRAGGAIRDEGWVFTAPDGGVLRPQYLTDNWLAACKRLELSWPLHSLRHAHISQLLANGVPVKVVQRRAGHANVNTALQVYAHVLPGQDEAAASVFAQVMAGQK